MYAYSQSEQSGLNASVAYLKKSLTGVYNTFFTFVTFPLELAHYVEEEKNPSARYLPTEDQTKRYKILIFSELREKLMTQPEFRRMMDKPSVNWSAERNFIQLGYKKLREASFVEKYMALPEYTAADQVAFLRDCYQFMANEFEEFDSFMEGVDMHWEDEKQPVLKSAEVFADNLARQYQHDQIEIPSLAKDIDEDMEFALELLQKSIRNQKEFTDIISSHTAGWDADRIARSDMLLMLMALVEYTEFPFIPVKVTLNEYLEIAKKYSTPQSSKFINGVLDKLLHQLMEEGKIIKKGRGLVE